MSLCLSMYHDNKFFVWADSRLSAEVGGKNYAISDEYDKLRRVGNRVIFMSGISELVGEVFDRIKPESSYEEIQSEAIAAYSDFVAAHKDSPGYADSKHGIELGIYLHEIVDGAPVLVQYGHHDNFEINKQTPGEADVFGVAAHSDVALPLFVRKINSSTPVEFAARRTFEYVADEIVGGYLTMLVIHPEGVMSSRCSIRDRKPVRWLRDLSIPLRADMQGNAVLNKLTANSANILGSSIKDGSIVGSSIDVGNGQFTVDTAGNMYAGSGRFRGSIISDTDINVTRDARVGNNIYLGLVGQVTDRSITFMDPGQYEAYVGFTGSNRELKVRGANDVRIDAGLDLFLKGGYITLQGSAFVGSATSGNRIVTASELSSKADVSALSGKADKAEAAYNMTYDSTTKNLKLWSRTGALLATVTLS